MRRKVGKCYPVFESCIFPRNHDENWCRKAKLPKVPNRFERVRNSDGIPREMENVIAFDCDISLPDDSQHCLQDKWFIYDDPVVITHIHQLRGHMHDGDVDFFISGPVVWEGSGVLRDPSTSRVIRYPYKIATYFPIRNILLIKGLTAKEPNESLKKLLDWIFRTVEKVAYKYNERGEALLIGCDPEFNIKDMMDETIRADTIFPSGSNDPVGCDGHSTTGELRPDPKSCPLKLTNEIRFLMNEVARGVGNDKKIVTGGGGDSHPLGHHIHFNKMLSSEELELLDTFVGKPALQIKGARRGGGYEVTGHQALRTQPHGCEYRTPASSLIPELTNALHTTAYCAVMKWESLVEGDSFEFQTDDATGIPTLEAYRMLDVTPEKKYTPHLEEYWRWVNHVDGREIDPKQDCLYRWIEGREEVKPQPGLKISWSMDIFPDAHKEQFIKILELEKIFDLAVFVLPPETEDGRVLQVCMSGDDKEKIEMGKIIELKSKYNLSKIAGFEHPTRKLGISPLLLEEIGTFRKLKNMVVTIAKVICV